MSLESYLPVTLAVRPFRPVPSPSPRPWAGTRLGPGVGELWLAGPDVTVANDGGVASLDALARELGPALVGRAGMAALGPRFPLIAKIIDAGDWLSLQVHPDDALARELYGPDAVGKAECWVVVEAAPGAELITGPAEGLPERGLRDAIATRRVGLAEVTRRPAVRGESLMLPAGTLHAIGAGALVYELEQPSDLTFRVSDWGRMGRALHVDESLRALRPELHAEPVGRDFRLDGDALEAPQLRLELPDLAAPVERRPGGRSLELVSALHGELRVSGDGWSETLARYATLVVPAALDAYRIQGTPDAVAAIGSLP